MVWNFNSLIILLQSSLPISRSPIPILHNNISIVTRLQRIQLLEQTNPILKGQNIHKDLNTNFKNKILKNNSVNINPSSSKSSKMKEGKTRILKRNLMLEIVLIKE
jgi:hypothetical protein